MRNVNRQIVKAVYVAATLACAHAQADVISTFESGAMDGYLGGYDVPNYTVALSNQFATDGNSALQITDTRGAFNVGGMIYLQNSGPTAAKFAEFMQSTTVLYDMTWMPGTSGYALSQAGLKRQSDGAFVRSGANPPPQPGFAYQMGVSPINMTAPITQTYIYNFGSVGFDFGASTWMQMWLVGNSGQNGSGNIGTAGPYTTYLDNIRVLKQLPTDPSWQTNGGGAWTNAGNWANGVPNSVDARATLAPVITSASATITLDTNATVGQLVFDAVQTSAGAATVARSYIVNGSGTMHFDVTSGRAQLFAFNQSGINIAVVKPFHELNVAVVTHDDLLVDTSTGATLTMGGPVAIGAGTTLSKSSAGTLNLNGAVTGGSLQLRGGVTIINANVDVANLTVMGASITSVNETPGGDRIVRTGGLTVDGLLNLANNDMIATASSYNAVTGLIASGRNGGAWTGPHGITSSSAAAASPKNKTLGTLTGAEYHVAQGAGALFNGFAIANTDVLVKFTYYGDVDFNGVVDFDDYSRIDAGFNNNRTGWFNGDVDYNGIVDFDDYSLIDQAFNTQSGTLRRAMAYLDGSDRSEVGMDAPSLQKVLQHFGQFGETYANGFLNSVPEPGALS
ncbi:MAG: hypothetical protein H7Z14_13435, partial [Anaerolineae bacterium]|nr:hypothetical protein [Phycisphaerae bacterium]